MDKIQIALSAFSVGWLGCLLFIHAIGLRGSKRKGEIDNHEPDQHSLRLRDEWRKTDFYRNNVKETDKSKYDNWLDDERGY